MQLIFALHCNTPQHKHTHTHICKTKPGLLFVEFGAAAKTFNQAAPPPPDASTDGCLANTSTSLHCNLQTFIGMLCFLRRWPRRLEMESCSLRSTREVLSGTTSIIALYHIYHFFFLLQLLLLVVFF